MKWSAVSWAVAAALGMSSVLMGGCAISTPISESADSILITFQPDEIELQGNTRATSRRFALLGVGFGERNSFLKNDIAARELVGADALFNRIRLKSFEGLLIPVSWLNALGIPVEDDIAILGWEVYTVGGMGVRYPGWHGSKGTEGTPADVK